MKDSIKTHVMKYKIQYSCVAAGIVSAGITYIIMRSRLDYSISRAIGVTAKGVHDVLGETSVNALEVNRGGLVLGNSYALNNVSFISSNRSGPPSWVVRCIETGGIFSSQNSCANEMGLATNELSQHLNGLREHVKDFHFERICMAA
jgi:hypothetical protein